MEVTRLVNYGYDCVGRTADAKEELASELAKIAVTFTDRNGKTPTIEVDESYPGVRIRRMTWLTEEQILELTDQADRIASYVRVKHGIAQRDPYPVILDKVGIPEVTGYDD